MGKFPLFHANPSPYPSPSESGLYRLVKARQLIGSHHPSYVLLAAASSCFISIYHSHVTGGARKTAKTPYPNAYCSREEIDKDKDKYICTNDCPSHLFELLPVFDPRRSTPLSPTLIPLMNIWPTSQLCTTCPRKLPRALPDIPSRTPGLRDSVSNYCECAGRPMGHIPDVVSLGVYSERQDKRRGKGFRGGILSA